MYLVNDRFCMLILLVLLLLFMCIDLDWDMF